MNFLTIIDTLLVTTKSNFSLVGNPVLVDGWKGGFAVELDGKTQMIESSDDNDCLSDPENCLFAGLTYKISLRLGALKDNMYILNSGGDLPGSRGIALYYYKKYLYLTISTIDKEWTIKTKFTKINLFFDLEFSWSIDGLDLFIDGERVGRRTRYIRRKIKGLLKYKWRFGAPIPNFRGYYAKCTVGTWQTWTATISIKDAVGVLSGKV